MALVLILDCGCPVTIWQGSEAQLPQGISLAELVAHAHDRHVREGCR